MGIDQTKVWHITCDRCRKDGGTVFADHGPQRPTGWEYETLHDCGLTGYTRHDLLCDGCVARKAREASRPAVKR